MLITTTSRQDLALRLPTCAVCLRDVPSLTVVGGRAEVVQVGVGGFQSNGNRLKSSALQPEVLPSLCHRGVLSETQPS